MRKTLIVFAMLLVLAAYLYGCAKTESQKGSESVSASAPETSASITPVTASPLSDTAQPPASLIQWVGYYKFYEEKTFDHILMYDISIYEEAGAYTAHFYIYGGQTLNEFEASVNGNINSVDFVFEKYDGENTSEPYKKGDVLLTLKKDQDALLTSWGAIRPMLKENEPSGEYIEKKTSAEASWRDTENKEVQILQETVLVNELNNNEKGLFYLSMTKDDLMSVLLDNDIYYYSMESDPWVGSSLNDSFYLYSFYLFDDVISLSVHEDVVSYIEIMGSIPLKATTSQSGLNLGDTFDKMVKLYGDDYTEDISSNPGEETYKVYRYEIGDHHFEVYFLTDTVVKWGVFT